MMDKQLEKINSGEKGQSLLMDDSYVYRRLPTATRKYLQVMLSRLPGELLEKIVETQFESDPDSSESEHDFVKHPKIPRITYPHEWPSQMFREAALFICRLAKELLNHNLYLGDFPPMELAISSRTVCIRRCPGYFG